MKLLLIIPHMAGGGAERVLSLLANEFANNGYNVEMLLTSAKADEVIRADLSPEIPLTLISEHISKTGVTLAERKANLLCKPYELAGKPVPAKLAYSSFVAQYGQEIEFIRNKLKSDPNMTAIAFLQPAIPMLMLAARGLPNKVIFSERADPNRLMKHRYGQLFIEAYYQRADAAVFQTKDALNVYPESVTQNAVVIPNPIKSGLPEPSDATRNKTVVTFCRISLQKNLPLLINAFARFHDSHPDYRLRIIGDAVNEEGRIVLADIKSLIQELKIADCVDLLPFSVNVHAEILNDGMYVNSSDYEGISNAMLEAMAIGLPVICTDCPIGGARQTIVDGENGLLVPVGDIEALTYAMSDIADNEDLSKRLSRAASLIRNDYSLKNIAKRWIDIL